MKKYFKKIIFILILICFNQNIYAKPLPPGSGEGDVPAQILILLDSSASMSRRISGTRVNEIVGISMDSDGRYYATQHSGRRGVLRFSTDGEIDRTYNGNRGIWAGNANDNCTMWHDSADGQFKSDLKSVNTLVSNPYQAQHAQFATDNAGSTMEDVMFVMGNNKVIGVGNDGSCKYYIQNNMRLIRNIDVKDYNNKSYLMFHGFNASWQCEMKIYNLTDKNVTSVIMGGYASQRYVCYSWRSALNSDMTRFYTAYGGSIYWLNLEPAGTHNYQMTAADRDNTNHAFQGYCLRTNRNGQLFQADNIDVSPNKSGDGDDIIFTVSRRGDRVQKFEIDQASGEGGCTFITDAGRWSNASNKGSTAGTVEAANIVTKNPRGLFVTSDRVLTGGQSGKLNVIDADLLDGTNDDTAWLMEMGSDPRNRWQGAKLAIKTLMNDQSLTSGAHFGFGHWNAGHGAENGFYKNTWPYGGKYCHRRLGCKYYGGWEKETAADGTVLEHPNGQSKICHSDGCVMVGIGPNGYEDILNKIDSIGLRWGTDGEAVGQMAEGYFTDATIGDPDNPTVRDDKSPCQLNYVIVIGDGNWTNHNAFKTHVTNLRKLSNGGVKTLVVAYGDGINARGMANFDAMAIAGSCNAAGDADCESTIVARTPAKLKSELESKIRQILAEKLSFTAPSITATVEKGGSLYQAQFEYAQFGEWEGTILRKTLKKDKVVEHEVPTFEDPSAGYVDDYGNPNWNAGFNLVQKAKDDGRRIWTVGEELDNESYIGVKENSWNNWNEDNSDAIQTELERLGNEVVDYHSDTSPCGDQDDVKGLINFMRGDDYFNYKGVCGTIDETRNRVMGDVYHSQLIEIGAPEASTSYTNTNQEAYWRHINGYSSQFVQQHKDRKRILYAGSNSGMLHAFDALTGEEEWAFIPPFMSGILPTIMNSNLLGKVDSSRAAKGGTNAIYGVDGSPIVHDVFMKGLDDTGEWENVPRWHSILMIPFGRGGAGFSVLDVTEPVIENDKGPMHMFTIFNDNVNSKVLIANNRGEITEHEYSTPSSGMGDSLEAQMAKRNYQTAEDTDGGFDSDTTDARDDISACQSNTSAGVTGNKFHTGGTASCYKGRTFTFDMVAPTNDDGSINKDTLTVFELVGSTMKKTDYQSAKMENGRLILTFAADKTFNFSGSALNEVPSDNFTVKISCHAETGVPYQWDYSQLGETWSTPRIARIPSAEPSRRNDLYYDRYVAIMGGGKGAANSCAGSAVYLVDLEKKGEIFGAVKEGDGNDPVALNGGPIRIVDTDPDGVTLEDGSKEKTNNGSDIGNSLPNSPVVITPDTAPGIPWRGAMVYINDFEGKITKINLTNSNEHGAEYFSQTTLARLNANKVNQRYSYFSMDAGIGQTDGELWLFGGTGDFANLGLVTTGMDNILYGVKDEDYPYFKHLKVKIPAPYTTAGAKDPNFFKYAHMGADQATSIDDTTLCVAKSGTGSTTACPDASQKAWRINLDITGDIQYRKVTGAPKLFKGVVYFPVYQPPAKGGNKCTIGDAYICAADDECGNNVSGLLKEAEGTSTTSISGTTDAIAEDTAGRTENPFACKGVRAGILSEIVVFADQLFANVAGPDEDKDTLYQTDAAKGEVSTSRGNWRDSSN